MAGPGDNSTAEPGRGRGELRASHADREQAIGILKSAFVRGMLVKEEFDQRVGQAFASRSQAELAALTADLSVEPLAARWPEPARSSGEQPVPRPGPLLAAGTGFYAGIWAFTLLPPWPLNAEGEPPPAIMMLLFSTTLIYLFVLAVTVGNMLACWREKRYRAMASSSPTASWEPRRLR